MKQCDHNWNYVHTIYAGKRGGSWCRRWCTKCGRKEAGLVRWSPERRGMFDETPARAAKEPT